MEVFRRTDDEGSIQVSDEPTITGRLDLLFIVTNCEGRMKALGHIRGDSVLQFRDWLNRVIKAYSLGDDDYDYAADDRNFDAARERRS